MIVSQAHRLLRRLTTPFDPDAFLTLVDPLAGSTLRGRVERVTPLTDSAAAVSIRPGRSWAGHVPGQFVTVGVDVDGVIHQRCYSLTSIPGSEDGTIEISVQATDGGTVSNQLVRRTRPGDVVRLSQATGDFTLGPADDTLAFITGGSGITPVMGMLRWLAQHRPCDVVVLHHATDPDRCMYLDELQELAAVHPWIRLHVSFTRAGGARLDGHRLDELCPDWQQRSTYVCGPAPLLDFATDHWEASAVLDRLHVERFSPVPRIGGSGCDGMSGTTLARFERSDVDVLADDGTPLLEIAEGAGLAPPSGCRMGICHTCSTRLVAGSMRDLRDGRVHQAGQHVQICVSSAVDDVTLDI